MITDSINFKMVKSLPNLDEAVALYKSVGWWKESPHSYEILPAMVRGSFCFIAAFDNQKLVGMGRVISDGVSDGFIQDVVVDAAYRGHHIGHEIIKRLLDFCLERQLDWISLIAEPGVASFYEELGFISLHDSTAMLYKNDK